MKEEFVNVGKPVPKKDAYEKAIGRATYIHDLKLPGMLYGKILYSRYPHARIVHIDTSKAEKLPGVKAVLTGYNIPEIRIGFYKDNTPLKKGKVYAMRDEVAAVAAIDPEIAEEALELIEVEYEPLPAVFDPEEAMKEDAPLIHEEHKTNVLRLPWKLVAGDVDEARKNSAYVVEDQFRVTRVTHCCMGTSGCVAVFDPQDNLTLYSITQIPYLAQRDFQEALKAMGLTGKKVRVIQTTIGGGFGSKLDTHCYEYIAILLAHRTRRPVKITFTREEEFKYTSPRQPAIIRIAQGCDR
ncbi:MAG: xanthine dehydrogenase family protein molybdopterin-binding subunit, partial [Deltaproteobacteria bacterium]